MNPECPTCGGRASEFEAALGETMRATCGRCGKVWEPSMQPPLPLSNNGINESIADIVNTGLTTVEQNLDRLEDMADVRLKDNPNDEEALEQKRTVQRVRQALA